MSGINGIIANKDVNHLQDRIKKMNESIAHRGIDKEAILQISDKSYFGYLHLAINNLSEKDEQPLTSNSGSVSINFDGQIFNFLEIKEKLSHEYDFKTNTDAEVILAGYELKGLDWILSQINGMFAFALFDKRNNSLILSRDRFGIKPLFYYQDDDLVIFSSEIKGILASGLINPTFNEKAIDDYLGHRYVREPYTFFNEIYQIPAAHYIQIKDVQIIQTKRYWQLPKLSFSTDYDENEIIYQTKTKLIDAINRWKTSEQPLGTLLSGGVDSSLTSAVIAMEKKEQLKTYIIGFKEKGFNEFDYAQMVAKKYNTQHTEYLLEQKDYFGEWEKLIEFKDAPLAVPNEIPLAIMSNYISKDVKVIISGEGADELFGGYGRIFRSAFDYSNLKNKKPDFYTYFMEFYEYTSRPLRNKFLKNKENYTKEFDSIIKEDFAASCNEENTFRYFHQYHIKGLLQRVDMTAMQASIEARPPFLDHELIEFVYTQVPYDLKLKWKDIESKQKAISSNAQVYSEELDTPKYILKKIAENYLPLDVIYRKKMGFPVPLNNWFPHLEKLSDELLHQATWLNQKETDELIKELKNGSLRSGQLLWMFLNIELFKNKYFTKNWIW